VMMVGSLALVTSRAKGRNKLMHWESKVDIGIDPLTLSRTFSLASVHRIPRSRSNKSHFAHMILPFF
jgi:hypothetical protein